MAVIFDESVVSPVLVGRAEYVDALGRIVEQAGDGRGHVVLITGEAGVGKSRLLAEVKARAVAEGWLALQGQCFEPDRTIPFAPLLEVLRDHLATLAPAELRRALGAAAPAITRLLPEIAGRLPDLSSLPPLEPEQQQHLFFAALAQHFQHLAAQRPLLLILEDLHWSDENSLEALLFLARRITTQRLLLWLSVRSDEATPALTRFVAELERRHVATEIELPRLSAEQVSQLVQAILHTEQPAGRDFVKDVYDLTNGNPFFVEEILKSLIAGGDIADTGEDLGRQTDRQAAHAAQFARCGVTTHREAQRGSERCSCQCSCGGPALRFCRSPVRNPIWRGRTAAVDQGVDRRAACA